MNKRIIRIVEKWISRIQYEYLDMDIDSISIYEVKLEKVRLSMPELVDYKVLVELSYSLSIDSNIYTNAINKVMTRNTIVLKCCISLLPVILLYSIFLFIRLWVNNSDLLTVALIASTVALPLYIGSIISEWICGTNEKCV